MNIQAQIEREKINVVQCKDIERLRQERITSIKDLERRKEMMIKEISRMDVLREPDRIKWFFDALCNAYFDKSMIL